MGLDNEHEASCLPVRLFFFSFALTLFPPAISIGIPVSRRSL